MNRTKPTLRTAALGLGVLLVAGITLAAAAPANASATSRGLFNEGVVYANDISSDTNAIAWHQATPGATQSVTDAGLVIAGDSEVRYTFAEDSAFQIENQLFLMYFYQGALKWTTTTDSAPAALQIPIEFTVNGSTSTSTLSSIDNVAGATVADYETEFTTSAAIGDLAAGSTAPLPDLLDAATAIDPAATILGYGVRATGAASVVTLLGFPLGTDATFDPATRTTAGAVSTTGSYSVGSTITAATSGWPAGTTFSYVWNSAGGYFGGAITDPSTSPSYTLTAAEDTLEVWATVTGTAPGQGPVEAETEHVVVTAAVTAPVAVAVPAAVAPAPVADSTALPAFLAAKGVTSAAATSAGLPADGLSPTTGYTANVAWASAADGYVDAYLYSSPVTLGSFPVVNGQVQVPLTAAVLTQLAAGSHTLVLVGQTSGAVQSVALTVSPVLAATGTDVALPLTAGVLLLLLGSTLFVMRRRASRV